MNQSFAGFIASDFCQFKRWKATMVWRGSLPRALVDSPDRGGNDHRLDKCCFYGGEGASV